MPKFTPEDEEQIRKYSEAAWSSTGIRFPTAKFTKGKNAKSYIKDAPSLFNDTVLALVREGYPLPCTLDKDSRRLHTAKFWNPFGIECTIVHNSTLGVDMAVLTEFSTPGDVSRFVASVREQKRLATETRLCYESARKKIKDMTDVYNSEVAKLLGKAGVLSFTQPAINFIDFKCAPSRDFGAFVRPSVDRTSSIASEVSKTEFDFSPYYKISYR